MFQPPMMNDKMKKGLSKAAVTGAAFAIGTGIIFGNASVSVMGYEMPSAVPSFIIGASASALSDVAHSYVNPELGTAQAKLGDVTATALGVGIAAGSAALLASSFVGLPSDNIVKYAGVAGASYLAADYFEMKFLENDGRPIW